jgi:hypothetical protein
MILSNQIIIMVVDNIYLLQQILDLENNSLVKI